MLGRFLRHAGFCSPGRDAILEQRTENAPARMNAHRSSLGQAPGQMVPVLPLWMKGGCRFGVALLLFVISLPAVAQEIEPTRLHENEDNAVIQALSVAGRYKGQYWSVNADQGSRAGWENRRMFLGVEVKSSAVGRNRFNGWTFLSGLRVYF